MTDEQIIEIRDRHLPSQGERFDCVAFARDIIDAAVAEVEQQVRKAWTDERLSAMSTWDRFAITVSGEYNGERVREITMEVEGIEFCPENVAAVRDLLRRIADIVEAGRGKVLVEPTGTGVTH